MIFVLSAIAAAFVLGTAVQDDGCRNQLMGYSCHEVAYRGDVAPVVDLRAEPYRLDRVWVPVQYHTPLGSSDGALVTVADSSQGQTRVMNRIDGSPMGPLVWRGVDITFENYNQAGFTLLPKHDRIGLYRAGVMEVQLRAQGIDRQVLRCSILAYTNTDYLNCELWSYNRDTGHFDKRGYLGFIPSDMQGAPPIEIGRYPAPPARTAPPTSRRYIPAEPVQPAPPAEYPRRSEPARQPPPAAQEPIQSRTRTKTPSPAAQEPVQQQPSKVRKGPSTTQPGSEIPVDIEPNLSRRP